MATMAESLQHLQTTLMVSGMILLFAMLTVVVTFATALVAVMSIDKIMSYGDLSPPATSCAVFLCGLVIVAVWYLVKPSLVQ
ncbi:hypothetical protein R1flu_028004 [Riccia fluitans]|uniref:NADH dehydrogenase subunit 6 n=1 Tax=Riccia fluitans TaxID=41844 RepID=A0ABD1XNE0_9MARC